MILIDANLTLGGTADQARFDTSTPEAALQMLDHFGIERALVRLTHQAEWSAVEGNHEVIEFTRNTDRLLPVWSVLPYQTDEFPKPALLAQTLAAAGVAALQRTPSVRIPLYEPLLYGDLLEAIEEAGVPLLDTSFEHDLSVIREITSLLKDHPRLRLVICINHAAWGIERFMYPLLERFERFMICLSGYHPAGGVQDMISRYGASRIVFGSGYPKLNPGGAVEFLSRLDISETDRELIASGNIAAAVFTRNGI